MSPHGLLALFPTFGQGNSIEVFRYHNLKLSKSYVFFVSVCYRQENMRLSIPAWTVMQKVPVSCEGRALLASREEGEQHSQMQVRLQGYLAQLPAEDVCEVVKMTGLLLKLFWGALTSLASSFLREGMVGLHFS